MIKIISGNRVLVSHLILLIDQDQKLRSMRDHDGAEAESSGSNRAS
jgi:hypothetical protein